MACETDLVFSVLKYREQKVTRYSYANRGCRLTINCALALVLAPKTSTATTNQQTRLTVYLVRLKNGAKKWRQS